MIRLVLFIFTILLAISESFATDADAKFRSANEFYQNNQFEKARSIYEKLISDGYISDDLYYNAGNTYFKLKQLAPAILMYEKALKINSTHEDSRFNLRVANSKIIDRIIPLPKLFIVDWLDGIQSIFSSDGWALFGIICLWIGISFLVLFILGKYSLSKKTFFAVSLVMLGLSALAMIFSLRVYHQNIDTIKAIVFEPAVYVKSSPDEASTDLFILHEGTKVIVTDWLGDWKEIRLLNGNKGWIKKTDIEQI